MITDKCSVRLTHPRVKLNIFLTDLRKKIVAVMQPAGHIVDQRDPSMAMVIAPLYPDDGLGSTTKIWPQGKPTFRPDTEFGGRPGVTCTYAVLFPCE